MMDQIGHFLRETLRLLRRGNSFATSLAILLIGSNVVFFALSGSAGIPVHFQQIHSTLVASNSVNAESPAAQQIDFGRSFQDLGVDGSIVIYDKNSNKFYEHNPARNTTAFSPASTFKIFNALVSLETGAIRDDITVLTWDGIKREVPAWNRDTNLRQAFKDSTVWFYQVLARKNGHERMQTFINQIGYGNRQIGTPEQIDRFWLEGPLQITPKQEIEFLLRLDRNDLPFSQPTMDLVKDIMIVERTPNYTLRGKTGWINRVTPNIGWFVGYLEQNNNVYYFATNITMPNPSDAAKRIELTRRSFKSLGLL